MLPTSYPHYPHFFLSRKSRFSFFSLCAIIKPTTLLYNKNGLEKVVQKQAKMIQAGDNYESHYTPK